MQVRPARIWLLSVAVLALGGCRTRLPLEPAGTAATPEAVAQPAAPASSGLSAFLHAEGGPEGVSTDPLRPFLTEVQPDRLRDMVRLDRLTDRRRGTWTFLLEAGPVCVPAHHR